MADIGTDLSRAAGFLREGRLVGIPTETVYGLAGNALDESAVAEIFRVKRRPSFDPLILHLSDEASLMQYVQGVPEQLLRLSRATWPGPLTLVLRKKETVPDMVTAGLDTVAVRVPAHPLTRELLKKLDFPLAAPSANLFGKVSPTSAVHVESQLGESIPYILDGGSAQVGLESTIIGWENDTGVVYRKGGMKIEDIRKFIPELDIRDHSDSNPRAPGMLSRHYAPHKKLVISQDINTMKNFYPEKRIGALRFRDFLSGVKHTNQVILSTTGDYNEAARNLFSSLRQLEKMPVDVVMVELLPEEDLGVAINDRLRRAAASG